jgi:hypothetical protein
MPIAAFDIPAARVFGRVALQPERLHGHRWADGAAPITLIEHWNPEAKK